MHPHQEGVPPSTVFNQAFFERDLVHLLDSYAKSSNSDAPAVEFQLRDGTRYRVSSIELLGSAWISFRGRLDNHDDNDGANLPGQITCGYEMISRVNFISHVLEKRVGFRMSR